MATALRPVRRAAAGAVRLFWRALPGALRERMLAHARVWMLSNAESFESQGLHVLPVHYSSPLPPLAELRADFASWFRPSAMRGVDLALDGQLELLQRLSSFRGECARLPSYTEAASAGFGPGFGEVEAHVLYAMLRHVRPRRLIEVGSGLSTYFTTLAAGETERATGERCAITCIEPYPYDGLRALTPQGIEIRQARVQEVPVEAFGVLQRGDVLFIDSSHVVRLNGDVNYLFLEVLPALEAGVYVHIHDIPFPYPVTDPEEWVFERRQFWTEAALVQAFLIHNDAFRVRLCTSTLHVSAPDALAAAFPVYDRARHWPASLWLEKVR